MKKIFFYMGLIITIIILVYSTTIHFKEKDSLTKERIWSIIDNVDGTLLGSIAMTGKKELSDDSKLDFIIKHIITNREYYRENISHSDMVLQKNGTIYYNFGKVDTRFLYSKILEYFTSFNYDINNSLSLYNDGYIELYYEPIEHIEYDSKEIINIQYNKGYIYMYIMYTRTMAQKTNNFLVEYKIDRYTYKIDNVKICESYMN